MGVAVSARYRLGLPAWAFPGWRGTCFDANADPLREYSRVFSTVEGNTTFYGIPSAAKVNAWREAVSGRDFTFCFKLPQTVTHRRRPDQQDLEALLHRIAPLEEHLGPLLVQFPPTVGFAELPAVRSICDALPRSWPLFLELRHPQLFDDFERWRPFREALRASRVIMDANPLHAGNPLHPEVVGALHEKAALPVHDWDATEGEQSPLLLRLVLHPDDGGTDAAIEAWAQRIAAHLKRGRACYITLHCPNNQHCPDHARRFHRALGQHVSLPELEAFRTAVQPGLFD